jgi:hypothetical protein
MTTITDPRPTSTREHMPSARPTSSPAAVAAPCGRAAGPHHAGSSADEGVAHPGCADCRLDLEHCHEASIEHADGLTECLGSQCRLPHTLHEWQLSCSIFDPPCPCAPDERDLFAEPLALEAAA